MNTNPLLVAIISGYLAINDHWGLWWFLAAFLIYDFAMDVKRGKIKL